MLGAGDYHRRAPWVEEPDRIFPLETERTISKDWVVRYQNRWFQLEAQRATATHPQGLVLVCEGRHGNIAIEYRGRPLRWQEVPAQGLAPGPAMKKTKRGRLLTK